jgi:hypothetical protein
MNAFVKPGQKPVGDFPIIRRKSRYPLMFEVALQCRPITSNPTVIQSLIMGAGAAAICEEKTRNGI